MTRFKKLTVLFLAAVMLLACAIPAMASKDSVHPMITPQEAKQDTKAKDRFTNILLLGVDYGFDGYWGSHHKQVLQECHTDAFMIVAIDMTTSEVSLVSIPRDTITYVPGEYGLYKLNAAFNCGETLEEGFKHACDAASWHLGGIKIDYYACVDMNAMVQLCDFIGGADIDVESTIENVGTKSDPRTYKKGLQHLDGQGLMDYARTRKSIRKNNNDIGRTARQRQVVTAIMEKLLADPSLIKPCWNLATGGELNFFTDLKLANVLNLANKVKDVQEIGNYVLTGTTEYNGSWIYTFTDQENRRSVIKEVWGIDVEDIAFTDYDSVKWFVGFGYTYVHCINLAKDLLQRGRAMENLTKKQKDLLDKLEKELDYTITKFDKAATSLNKKDRDPLTKANRGLANAGKNVQKELFPDEKAVKWEAKTDWWEADTYINEHSNIDWN